MRPEAMDVVLFIKDVVDTAVFERFEVATDIQFVLIQPSEC
jgi:hypothetical protein